MGAAARVGAVSATSATRCYRRCSYILTWINNGKDRPTMLRHCSTEVKKKLVFDPVILRV